jgi:hypothetical protein
VSFIHATWDAPDDLRSSSTNFDTRITGRSRRNRFQRYPDSSSVHQLWMTGPCQPATASSSGFFENTSTWVGKPQILLDSSSPIFSIAINNADALLPWPTQRRTFWESARLILIVHQTFTKCQLLPLIFHQRLSRKRRLVKRGQSWVERVSCSP